MTLEEIRRAEYLARRRVGALRLQVYGRTDPSTDAIRVLQDGERRWRELRDQVTAAEHDERSERAVVLDTTAPASGGVQMGADTTGIDARVTLRMSHVPTAIVHLLSAETTPLVSFDITNSNERTVRVRVTAAVEGYSASSTATVEIQTDATATLALLPTFFPAGIDAVRELTRATLQVTVENLDANIEQAASYPIWLLARTSAYNAVLDPSTGSWIELSDYYAAWVTPNVLEVQQLVRDAADLHPDGMIVGYQGDPAAGATSQVKAIYTALKAKGITYVNSVISFGAGELESMQRVRLPREALANRSANCIDGTVLMASVLEAASINPGIVLVPGHAFLAWETWEQSGEWDYVETTMIGSHDFEAAVGQGRAEAQEHNAVPRSIATLRVAGITPME